MCVIMTLEPKTKIKLSQLFLVLLRPQLLVNRQAGVPVQNLKRQWISCLRCIRENGGSIHKGRLTFKVVRHNYMPAFLSKVVSKDKVVLCKPKSIWQ